MAVFLFDGLPVAWQGLFVTSFVVVVVAFVWSVSLYVRGARWVHADRRRAEAAAGTADEFLWVFLVPALNEEVTIRDSVTRLLQVEVAHRQIVVIDDGSDDATGEVVASIDHPDLRVLRRELPDARVGKAAALNEAYASLDVGGFDRDRVIVVIVDADGRLGVDAPVHAATHFVDPRVAGVQALVRIYNRGRLLSWFQHIEFGVYGHLFQAGRNAVGTAGMGGNGQFNRLSALDDIAHDDGPWQDRLTEDQDLGLRLVAAGWQVRQDLHATVDQQGLAALRPLLRQRTRWSQGNLQAMSLTPQVMRARLPWPARLECLLYLGIPVMQAIVAVSVVVSLVLAVTGVAPFWSGGPTWQLLLVYLLCFGGTVMGCVAARRDEGVVGRLRGFVIGHAFSLYTWLTWPVLARAVWRQTRRRLDWDKTDREAIAADDAPASVAVCAATTPNQGA